MSFLHLFRTQFHSTYPNKTFFLGSLQADSEAVNGAAYAVSRSGPTSGLKSQAASSHMCSMPWSCGKEVLSNLVSRQSS